MSDRLCFLAGAVCVFASMVSTITTSSAVASPMLGFESSSLLASNADASPDLLAGSHPYALTTAIRLNTTSTPEGRLVPEGGDLKDLLTDLPPGLIINSLAIPRCGSEEFANVNVGTDEDGCPNASAVGIVTVENVAAPTLSKRQVSVYPIYNLAAPQDSPALLGFRVAGVAVYLTASVRTGNGYGLTLAMTGIPQDVHVLGSTVTFWGTPAESTHDHERGDCIQSHGMCPAGVSPKPFLALPTQCLTSPTAQLRADSWQEPGQFNAFASDTIIGGGMMLTACEMLDFSPTFDAKTESSTADAPTGLKLHIHMPQSQDSLALTEAALENAAVTLPAGMTFNLSRANSLVGCPLKGPGGINLDSSEPSGCPAESKIGSVKIKTAILPSDLQGDVYIAQQGNLPGGDTNPFKTLIALYILAKGSGVVIKLPVEVVANPQTGQLTMQIGPDPVTGETFAPALPFEDIELEFFGGTDGVLVTPPACGSYATSASLTPWNGASPAALADELQITQGCTDAFNPFFYSDTPNKQANGYSPFTITLARQDGEQEIRSLSITMPPGLQGTLRGVTLCPEPKASLGTCEVESLIGETTVSVGAGPDPFPIRGGKVYLTGPYGGAPFGLSLVEPAVAGPFNLGPEGRPIIIRAAIRVDPITAQITVLTDAGGPYSIPSILEGILPQTKAVYININRPEFIFNPTKCAPQSVTGTIMSTGGAITAVSSPFQATNCASLPFSPRLRASTVGRPSRTNGVGFNVKIVQGVAGEANAQSVKVDLPKQLPSRLTTLQNACRAAIFQSNPADCPAGSIVGTATAVTPLLPVAMTGPAYFVSHGGAKFPELVIVLQGYGVTIDLYGETFINKAGVTSSTFSQIPDAPVSSFELHLPAGSDSALTAHANLCLGDLRTPTTIIAQNGLVVKEDPKVAVGNCPRALNVVRHSVRRGVARVVILVPSAGKLVASGSGIARATRWVKKAGMVTVRLTFSKNQRHLLAHHRGHKLRVAVKLLFVPNHGVRLFGHVTVILR